jgi:Transposase IS116/IS110/IS902 family
MDEQHRRGETRQSDSRRGCVVEARRARDSEVAVPSAETIQRPARSIGIAADRRPDATRPQDELAGGPAAVGWSGQHINDPLRFVRSRTVGAYFGLTPRRHQSGTSIDYEGRITKMGDINARDALCEAAASLLLRSRRWSALKAWGLRIVKRTSMMGAIVAVARKLAAILHRMWLDGSEFRWSAGAKITEKVKLVPRTA